MTAPNKIRANRENALKSTGPRSTAGLARSSRNALAHGLYTAGVVPTVGESPEAFAALCAAVRRRLSAEGVIEARLADRVAMLLWRHDRLMRYEAATATLAISGADLPPDPDSVTGFGLDATRPAPGPGDPLADRLAFTKSVLREWELGRGECRAALAALDGAPTPNAVALMRTSAVRKELEPLTGWEFEEGVERWHAMVTAWARRPEPPDFRALLGELAREVGKCPDAISSALREGLTRQLAGYDARIAQKAPEAEALAAEMRAAREAARAAALYGDGEAAERVIRIEAHLTRQLTLTLDLLARLRGEGAGGGKGGGLGVLLEALAVGMPRPLPLPVASFRNGGPGEVERPVPPRGAKAENDL